MRIELASVVMALMTTGATIPAALPEVLQIPITTPENLNEKEIRYQK